MALSLSEAMVLWGRQGTDVGFLRKIRRKQQKQFMKDFKKSMKNFKLQVKCSVCGVRPEEGQKIDDWRIDKDSNGIDLICTECYSEREVENNEEL